MGDAALKNTGAAYDVVGRFSQDSVNGFTDKLLDHMLELVDPAHASSILDSMGGDGNLALRLFDYCKRHKIKFPSVTMLEYSRVQYEFARAQLANLPAKLVHGDVLTMSSNDGKEHLKDSSFDRVMLKSANHEIPLEKQLQLYQSIYRVLKEGGTFVNLGFLFDDPQERDELRRIARVKDTLSGMHSAVVNRYFLTREEFYSFLTQAGFTEIRCAERFEYTIHSALVAQRYFNSEKRDEMDLEHQAAQAKARIMRRKGRIRFEGDASIMICPGELTIARKPTAEEREAIAFRQCPYDFLRYIKAHFQLMQDAAHYIPARSKVFDLGCGTGLLAERLVPKNVTYKGYDISRDFIAKCRERYGSHSEFSFDVADVMNVDLGTATGDVVAIINLLFLSSIDPIKLLRKSFTALKKGGLVVVSGPTSNESFKKAEPFIIADLERDGILKGNEEIIRAVRTANDQILSNQANYWSVEGMVALLKELGFDTIVAKTEIYYGFGYMVIAKKA